MCHPLLEHFTLFLPSTSPVPIHDSLTFSFFDLSWLRLPSQSLFLSFLQCSYPFISSFTLPSQVSNKNWCNSQHFVFIQTFSTFVESSMIFDLAHLTEGPYNCNHRKLEVIFSRNVLSAVFFLKNYTLPHFLALSRLSCCALYYKISTYTDLNPTLQYQSHLYVWVVS